MILISSKYLVPNGFRSITLFPFIFLKYEGDKLNNVLINHEKIHTRQQLELFILPFFIWYLLEYVSNFIKYRDKNLAYRNISFEREAYFHENDMNYLNKRSLWAFILFLKN